MDTSEFQELMRIEQLAAAEKNGQVAYLEDTGTVYIAKYPLTDEEKKEMEYGKNLRINSFLDDAISLSFDYTANGLSNADKIFLRKQVNSRIEQMVLAKPNLNVADEMGEVYRIVADFCSGNDAHFNFEGFKRAYKKIDLNLNNSTNNLADNN